MLLLYLKESKRFINESKTKNVVFPGWWEGYGGLMVMLWLERKGGTSRLIPGEMTIAFYLHSRLLIIILVLIIIIVLIIILVLMIGCLQHYDPSHHQNVQHSPPQIDMWSRSLIMEGNQGMTQLFKAKDRTNVLNAEERIFLVRAL